MRLLYGIDEDMTPMDTPMKVKDKVSSFLCLYNDKTKNLLLPNISISNMLRNDGDDDSVWICHESPILECKLIKVQHSVRRQPDSASLRRS